PLSVSGPAAGLIAIVVAGIDQVGSWEAFLVAVFLGGLLQIALGLFKAGAIAYFFPNSVIKGMLAAIGLILIRKQLPHAFGLDIEAIDEEFHLSNTIPVFREIMLEGHYEMGALIISLLSIGILILWDQTGLKKIVWLPGALVVVIGGVLLNLFFGNAMPAWELLGSQIDAAGNLIEPGHLVALPQSLVQNGISGFFQEITFPDWSALTNPNIYTIGLTIGLVATMETLLSVEAVDKLDPHKRQSPLNRELLAQGVANTLAGLLGALPITAVIVRSSANVNAGGQTRMAALIHGILLFLSVVTIASVLNLIPLASLAAILLLIGYKLAHPKLFKAMYREGMNRFLPFVITVVAVLVTDLLVGIAIGTAVGIFFTIKANFRSAIVVSTSEGSTLVKFQKNVSFLNKAILTQTLNDIPAGTHVIVDGTDVDFIDHDIQEILWEYQIRAKENDIKLDIVGVKPEDAHVPILN
ncbi:MAG: SulP family inorganic anion transporter, partial [Bacteroidia bacterium]|nr:SulP family inorganic anion transporter [Bacteroidia bacterium]